MAANNNNNNNNNGRNNNNNNNNNMSNDHVEFSVKAEEDLYLQGAESTIRRVTAETNYSCLMLKTQRFSSLFRHYAKYHGLRKDDLEYYFVNVLENEDTPETVQLQRADTIMVRKRRTPQPPPSAADDDDFFDAMKDLLDEPTHHDVVLQLPNDEGTVSAHKAVLTARTEYFKQALAVTDSMGETTSSTTSTAVVPVDFAERHVRAALEFIYTNRLAPTTATGLDTSDWVTLLRLADAWKLRDLKRWTELVLMSHVDVSSVAKLYGATESIEAPRLQHACIEFITANLRQLTGNTAFEAEIQQYPTLCIPVLKMAANYIPSHQPAQKKQRTDAGTPSSAAYRSSPVPDMDL